jgi:hypothetical protein
MIRPRFAATLLALLMLLATMAAGSAQTPSASAIPPIDQFTGIQAAASRTYGPNIDASQAATPGDAPVGAVSASIIVLEFDNAGNAATAYDAFSTGLVQDLPMLAQGGTPEVNTGDIADIGSRASMARMHTTSGDFESWLEFVTVQDDRYVFVVSSLANAEDAAGLAISVAAWVATNGEANGDEAIFVGEGGSSGGIWGFMPPTGDEVLNGLVPIVDEILYPAPGA